MGTVPKTWAVFTQMWLIAPGTQNLCAVALKSQATAHATGPNSNMGKGEFAAALSSLRALMMVMGSAIWGRAFGVLLQAGKPPSWTWVGVACLGACVPEIIHRCIPDKQWALPSSTANARPVRESDSDGAD